MSPMAVALSAACHDSSFISLDNAEEVYLSVLELSSERLHQV